MRVFNVARKYPFAFGVGFSTIKTSASDLLVQKGVEQREEIDWRRNAAFATFGCFYLGMVQYMIYVPIFGRLFPAAEGFAAKSISAKARDRKGLTSLGSQVFLDQCVHHPILYFPVFYCTKELVQKGEDADFGAALRQYGENFEEDMLALWKIWVPSTILNFAFMPMWGRIPWVATTSLIWTCILSYMRGGSSSNIMEEDDLIGGNVTGATFKVVQSQFNAIWTAPVELSELSSNGLQSHVLLTATGPDQVGLVAKLARAVANEGGNVTMSKMVRLGGQFTIMMHVAIPNSKKKRFLEKLKATGSKHLSVSLTNVHVQYDEASAPEENEPKWNISIRCVGADQPGIIALIAEDLARADINIEDLSTEVQLNEQGQPDICVVVRAVCQGRASEDHVTAFKTRLKDSLTSSEYGIHLLSVQARRS